MSLASLDETHDPDLHSWVDNADGHPEFPLQNLPFARFSADGRNAGPGVAIGDSIASLQDLLDCDLLVGDAREAAVAACQPTETSLIGLTSAHRLALRRALSALLRVGGVSSDRARQAAPRFLFETSHCTLHLPARVSSYTDFNAGIHHAANGGRRRGLKDPVLPNYRHVPIAYHSRASSVRPSGAPVQRPWGQFLCEGEEHPVFEPTRKLDFELELGIWIGSGNEWGEPIDIRDAPNHIAGYCLVNDWSARDIQAWESQRLGPFLGKNFCTTVSPWVVTPEALAPFQGPAFNREGAHPRPLPYLEDPDDARHGLPQLHLEVLFGSKGDEAKVVSRSHSRHLFWTPAQMLTHHASNGCNMQVGDLLGSGTVTGTDPDSFGTFLDAPTPRFLADGDSLVLRAKARREGFATIGFGDCAGQVQAARRMRQ